MNGISNPLEESPMKVRAVAFGLLLFSLSVTVWMLNTWAYPEIGTSLALGQVNDPDGKASIALRVWQGAPELAIMLAVSVAIVGVVLFLPELRQLWSRLRAAVYSKYLDPYKGQKSRATQEDMT